ncbi:MAG: GMP synthase [Proteobacteria bacterium]|nr:GMP synthase [Pseudomonadota bacterium]
MKLGIFQCDQVREELRDEYHSYPKMFQDLFHSVGGKLHYQIFNVVEDEYPEAVDQCDAYLVSGSSHSAYEDLPWVINLISYIKLLDQKEKPMVGVCFGHQIIAQALGGKVIEQIDKGWGVGIDCFNILNKGVFADTNQKSISLLMSHKDQVSKLPLDCVVSQSNEFCPIAGFIKNRHILTFQGHPEFTKEFLRALMSFRRDLIGEQKYQKALSSLSQKTDSKIVATGILNFIEKGSIRSSL